MPVNVVSHRGAKSFLGTRNLDSGKGAKVEQCAFSEKLSLNQMFPKKHPPCIRHWQPFRCKKTFKRWRKTIARTPCAKPKRLYGTKTSDIRRDWCMPLLEKQKNATTRLSRQERRPAHLNHAYTEIKVKKNTAPTTQPTTTSTTTTTGRTVCLCCRPGRAHLQYIYICEAFRQ